MIDKAHPLPITHQARLLGLARSSVYHRPADAGERDLAIMAAMDEIHTELPFYGIRRIRGELLARGFTVGRGHVATPMRRIGIRALAPKRQLSKAAPGHKIYRYLLRGLEIREAGHVWSADVTYLPLRRGFCYLVAVIDWASRCPFRPPAGCTEEAAAEGSLLVRNKGEPGSKEEREGYEREDRQQDDC